MPAVSVYRGRGERPLRDLSQDQIHFYHSPAREGFAPSFGLKLTSGTSSDLPHQCGQHSICCRTIISSESQVPTRNDFLLLYPLSICFAFYSSSSFFFYFMLFIILPIHLSIYLSIFLSIYVHVSVSLFTLTYLSIYRSIYLSIYLSVCLSIYLIS